MKHRSNPKKFVKHYPRVHVRPSIDKPGQWFAYAVAAHDEPLIIGDGVNARAGLWAPTPAEAADQALNLCRYGSTK